MGLEFTLATLALGITLIGVKMAVDNSTKVSNMLSNLKGSCKSRWVFK